ncbi:MAG: amidase [Vampirovibrionales bacterium]
MFARAIMQGEYGLSHGEVVCWDKRLLGEGSPQQASDPPWLLQSMRTLHEASQSISSEARIQLYQQWLEASLTRIRALEPYLQAWQTDFSGVSEGSRYLPQKHPLNEVPLLRPSCLQGFPTGVKDTMATLAFPTLMGTPLWQTPHMGHNARMVACMEEAQCVLLGKTTTAEYGVHTPVLKQTLNPWAAERHPGTSSTGAAVAVASGMIPWAIGTQTGASLTRPASYTGVYALKPTFGLLPRTGILKTSDTLDTVGFFAQWATDLYPLLETLRVSGKNHPYVHRSLDARASRPFTRRYLGAKPWRVGVLMHPPWETVASQTSQATQEALQAFYAWCQKASQQWGEGWKPVTLPPEVHTLHELHACLYQASLAYYTKEEWRAKRLELDGSHTFSEALTRMIVAGERITPQAYREALAAQDAWIHTLDAWWQAQAIDILLTPSTMGVAPPLTEAEWADAGLVWTLSHVPVVNIPFVLTSTTQNPLPMGISAVAPRYHDDMLLSWLMEGVSKHVFPPRSVTPLCI